MSPARCRSPALVFRYTPKPMSAPSERNCHLQGRGAVLWQRGDTAVAVTHSLRRGAAAHLRTQPGKRISYSTWWDEPRLTTTECSYFCASWSRT